MFATRRNSYKELSVTRIIFLYAYININIDIYITCTFYTAYNNINKENQKEGKKREEKKDRETRARAVLFLQAEIKCDHEGETRSFPFIAARVSSGIQFRSSTSIESSILRFLRLRRTKGLARIVCVAHVFADKYDCWWYRHARTFSFKRSRKEHVYDFLPEFC